MRGIMAGDLPEPPWSYLFGMRLREVEEGRAVFAFPASEWLASPARALYGGALANAMDVALAIAVQTTVPAATAFSALDLKVNYIRPVFPDGRDLVAEARVVHRGRSLCVSSGEIRNADGKVVVLATGSTLILPDRPWTVAVPIVAEEETPGEEADG
jgi:uncharacterized protein (TIGR00369 family)